MAEPTSTAEHEGVIARDDAELDRGDAEPGATALSGAAPDGTAGAPATGRLRWLTAGARSPTLPLRRPLVRVVVALTSTTALLAVAGVVAAAAIVPPIGARLAARTSAQREVRAQLRPHEYVIASVYASQRRWTDMFRESFGVLVATDQRLLYVGAPPMPLLRPRDDGPEELLVESYPYDAAFTLEPRRMFRGYVRGLELRTPATTVDFIVDDAMWADATTVAQLSAAARRANTQQEQAVDESARPALPPAEEYTGYVVQRGENLTSLARRFHTTPDVLRQLNKLTSDEIRSGQRLRVPRLPVAPDSQP